MLRKRLVQLRGTRSQEEVASTIGISRARYSHYETGRSEPDMDTLQRLAGFYNCSTDYLFGLTPLKQGPTMDDFRKLISDIPSKDALPLTPVPVLKASELETIREVGSTYSSQDVEGWCNIPAKIDGEFALRVNDGHLADAFLDPGDYVICRWDNAPQSERLVVVLSEQKKLSLQYLNDDRSSAVLDEGPIIGKVVGILKEPPGTEERMADMLEVGRLAREAEALTPEQRRKLLELIQVMRGNS